MQSKSNVLFAERIVTGYERIGRAYRRGNWTESPMMPRYENAAELIAYSSDSVRLWLRDRAANFAKERVKDIFTKTYVEWLSDQISDASDIVREVGPAQIQRNLLSKIPPVASFVDQFGSSNKIVVPFSVYEFNANTDYKASDGTVYRLEILMDTHVPNDTFLDNSSIDTGIVRPIYVPIMPTTLLVRSK